MADIFRNLDWTIVLRIIPALICITLHELAHGYTAYRLGDPTAKNMGWLTLNPIKHIELFGILMMVVARFGWAKPVPVNRRYFKNPKGHMAITALAGPVSNIILAVVVYFIFGLIYELFGGLYATGASRVVLDIVYSCAELSVILAIFNLLPIPPLDGSKILFSLLPEQSYDKLMRYERFGMIILILFVWSPIFGETFGRITFAASDWFFGISRFAHGLVN